MLYRMNVDEFVTFLDADKFEYQDSCIFFEQEGLKVFIKHRGNLFLSMEFNNSYEKNNTNTCSSSTCLSAFRQTKDLVHKISSIGCSVITEFYDSDEFGDYRKRLGSLLSFQPRIGSKVWVILGKE